MTATNPDRLLVLWTTADKISALEMVFLYTTNAKRKGWFENVTLLIWGASTGLTVEDEEIQAALEKAQQEGVRTIACLRCAEDLDVVDDLVDLGVEAFYTGEFLSDWLKSGDALLSV